MKEKLENKFLIIAFLFGLISILLIPPFQSPDESSHFQRAYSVSRGQLYYSVVDNERGLYIEDELSNFVSSLERFNGNVNTKFSYGEVYFGQEMGKLPTGTTHKFVSTVSTSFIAYIASSLGIIVSKIFRIGVFHTSTTYIYSLYFARLFDLVLYIGLMYFAIKKTPILKKSMVTVGLLPMSIMLASSCSYDGLILGSACLIFSHIMSLLYESKKVNYRDILFFVIFGFLLFFIKYTYVLLLTLLLFVPVDRFKNKKDKLIKIGMIFGFIFLLYLISNIPNYLNSIDGGSAGGQLKFILSHPFKYTYILFKSMYLKSGLQLSWILGGFGNLDTHFPGFIYFVMLIYLLVLFYFDASSKKSKVSIKMKLWNFLVLFLIIIGIYTALYMIWNPVGSDSIEGVQGRYFLPIVIFTPLLVFGNKASEKFKNVSEFLENHFVYFSITFLVLYCLMLLLRFWI